MGKFVQPCWISTGVTLLGNRMENPFDLSTDAGFALLVFAFFYICFFWAVVFTIIDFC